MVALSNRGCIAMSEMLPAIHGGHDAWRYTLMSGLIPAIPLILIRPLLPESPVWQQKRAAGTLKRPSLAALFAPEYRRTTVVTTILFACSYGIALGAIQHLPQIVPGMADVKTEAAAAKEHLKTAVVSQGKPEPTPKELAAAGRRIEDDAAATVQSWQETGGLIGRILLAAIAVYIVGRRALFRLFQIPSLLFVPLLFLWLGNSLGQPGNLGLIKWGVLLAGLFTVGQFSFWGNYLPRVYPVHLRGTGESFAANIGGRVLGTSAAWVTLTLSAATPPDPARIAWTAAAVAGTAALVGAIVTQWMPEPGKVDLPD